MQPTNNTQNNNPQNNNADNNNFGRRRGGNAPRPKRDNTPKDGLREKVLDLRRVTRVVAGGKRFRFRASVAVGDERGRLGLGVAKGLDVAQSVAKARAKAAQRLVEIPLKESRTIPHETYAKYSAAKVLIKPAATGHGLRAGGSVRSVLALVGIRDATAKCLGRTPNKLTNAWATLEALKKLTSESPKTRAERRSNLDKKQ